MSPSPPAGCRRVRDRRAAAEPLTAEWIPISNILFPNLQKIMLGDLSAEDGLNAAAKAARDDLVSAGVLK